MIISILLRHLIISLRLNAYIFLKNEKCQCLKSSTSQVPEHGGLRTHVAHVMCPQFVLKLVNFLAPKGAQGVTMSVYP